jgi:hypothetical protein
MGGGILSVISALNVEVSGGRVMPRYFFNIVDHGRENDDEGMALPDAAAARIAGISYAGSVLHNEPHLLDGDKPLRVEVTDDAGQLIYKVVMSLVDEAALTSEA